MCVGIALAYGELPLDLIEGHGLKRRVHERGGEKEFRFLYREAHRVLPVWHEGRLHIARWGCRRGESRILPCTGWTWQAKVEAGFWSGLDAAEVEIPATLGLANGVWFRVRRGMRGALVHDEGGMPVVYMVCEPASHYYAIMTRCKWMPVLVGERI